MNLETYLCNCIYYKVEYCFSFNELPNRKQVESHLRDKFGYVFDDLDAYHNSNNEPSHLSSSFAPENLTVSKDSSLVGTASVQ